MRPGFAVACLAFAGCASIGPELAPDFQLIEATYPDAYSGPPPISAKQALRSATHSLQSRGVVDLRLCSMNWFVAAVGGAMVYATGKWQKDGVFYDSFAVFIYDGTEVKYGLVGGHEAFVVARGVDQDGKETYYDSAGNGGPKVLRYQEEIAGNAENELIFEYVNREVLTGLRAQCGAH